MINDVHRSLFAFWGNIEFGGTKIPVYLSGHVPPNTAFPYITFEVSSAESMSFNVLTAFDWHKAESGKNVNAERASMMDEIAKMIPAEGVLLELPGEHGYIELLRNDADFQTYYDDPEDETVVGGRTSYIVRYYTL